MGTTVGICSVIRFLRMSSFTRLSATGKTPPAAAEAYRNMWLMGMAALGMVIVFTFLLFQKIGTDHAQWLAASKPGKLQEKNHVEKIHHRD